jgi:hypothetical protein
MKMARNQSTKRQEKNPATTNTKRKVSSKNTVEPSTTSHSRTSSHIDEQPIFETDEVKIDRPIPGEADSVSESQRSSSQAADTMSRAEEESHELINRHIAERAFLLYLECGCQHGRDLEHWLEAEHEIRTNNHQPKETT